MICPLFQRSQQHPNSPYWIGAQIITFQQMHQQVNACVEYLNTIPLTQPLAMPLAIDSTDPIALMAWFWAAARTGQCIVIPSTKDPHDIRDHMLNSMNIRIDSLSWTLPISLSLHHKDPHKDPPSIVTQHTPLCMLFTSGSSGTPKVVVHSFSTLWHSAQFSHNNIAFSHGDRWLQSLFLWHIGGLMIPIRAIFGGAAVVQKDHSISMGDQISRDQISHLSMVPTQLDDLLKEDCALPSLKAVLIGGGSIPSALVSSAYNQHIPIHTTYGMTELGSQLSTTPPNSDRTTLQSAGSPLGDWTITIDDREEILVQGSPLFLGYWNGSNIEDPRDPNGDFRTGDRGSFIDGKLYPLGRVDQMFISGGENIYPEEIEDVFHQIGIFAIVVPILDDRYGHRPVAFLRVSTLDSDIERTINTAMHTHLPKFKHPDHLLLWPEEVSTYKPSRRHLQDIAGMWITEQRFH